MVEMRHTHGKLKDNTSKLKHPRIKRDNEGSRGLGKGEPTIGCGLDGQRELGDWLRGA